MQRPVGGRRAKRPHPAQNKPLAQRRERREGAGGSAGSEPSLPHCASSTSPPGEKRRAARVQRGRPIAPRQGVDWNIRAGHRQVHDRKPKDKGGDARGPTPRTCRTVRLAGADWGPRTARRRAELHTHGIQQHGALRRKPEARSTCVFNGSLVVFATRGEVPMILPQVHLRKPCYDFSFL